MVRNPTSRKIEVMCDGQIEIFEPGESKPLEGFFAFHVLNQVNCGLVEDTGEEKSNLTSTNYEISMKPDNTPLNVSPNSQSEINLNEMGWADLRRYASQKGVNWKPGMKRDEVMALLEAKMNE